MFVARQGNLARAVVRLLRSLPTAPGGGPIASQQAAPHESEAAAGRGGTIGARRCRRGSHYGRPRFLKISLQSLEIVSSCSRLLLLAVQQSRSAMHSRSFRVFRTKCAIWSANCSSAAPIVRRFRRCEVSPWALRAALISRCPARGRSRSRETRVRIVGKMPAKGPEIRRQSAHDWRVAQRDRGIGAKNHGLEFFRRGSRALGRITACVRGKAGPGG